MGDGTIADVHVCPTPFPWFNSRFMADFIYVSHLMTNTKMAKLRWTRKNCLAHAHLNSARLTQCNAMGGWEAVRPMWGVARRNDHLLPFPCGPTAIYFHIRVYPLFKMNTTIERRVVSVGYCGYLADNAGQTSVRSCDRGDGAVHCSRIRDSNSSCIHSITCIHRTTGATSQFNNRPQKMSAVTI